MFVLQKEILKYLNLTSYLMIIMTEPRLYKIKNIEGLDDYRITKCGKLWDNNKKEFMKLRILNGYNVRHINRKCLSIHRLVALTFINNPDNKPYVDHIDSNKLNNNVINLRWATQKENCSYHGKKIEHPRRVIQLDKDTGEEINTFDSLIDAAKAVGKTPSTISKVLIGKNKTGGGYKWKYENQEDERDEWNIKNAKCIKGFPKYMVFKDGRIYNTTRRKEVKPVKNLNGHCYVSLCHQGKKSNKYIHNEVAKAFLSNPNNYRYVRHINKIIDDNRLENLEWIKSVKTQTKASTTNSQKETL